MLLVGAVLAAVFWLSPPWNAVVVIVAAVVEIVETAFWIKLSQRWRVRAGAETLIGARAVATTDLAPEGHVRVQGELWQARAEVGAAAGDVLRVTARDGLLLLVEPAEPDGDRRVAAPAAPGGEGRSRQGPK